MYSGTRGGCFLMSELPLKAAGTAYEEEVYLVTTFVPSDTACLAISPEHNTAHSDPPNQTP
jgi:hypothetical protein